MTETKVIRVMVEIDELRDYIKHIATKIFDEVTDYEVNLLYNTVISVVDESFDFNPIFPDNIPNDLILEFDMLVDLSSNLANIKIDRDDIKRELLILLIHYQTVISSKYEHLKRFFKSASYSSIRPMMNFHVLINIIAARDI